MSQQPSGWYDDPSNPEMLRYWDGVTWTNHTTPKKSPTASQSTIGLPQPVPPAARHTQPVRPDAPHGQVPPGGQYPQSPQSASWMAGVKTTADGVPLASWGRRLGAWILDGILIGFVAQFFVRALVSDYDKVVQNLVDAISSGSQTQLQNAMADFGPTSARIALITYLVTSAYAIAFWTTTGQTLGKLAVGISVRRTDRPGPLDLVTALKRRALALGSVIPGLNGFWGLVTLLDGLFPLWDDKRQALHDKIADTQVVMGKQPRKGA